MAMASTKRGAGRRDRIDPVEVRAQIQSMLFKHLKQGMTTKDLSIRLGVSVTVTRKYLKMMAQEGIVEQVEGWASGWAAHAYKLTNLALMQDPDNEYIDNE